MSPSLEPQVRQLLTLGDVNAARLATADWMIGLIAAAARADHSDVTSAFLTFSPNLMPMLDSREGVQAIGMALSAMLGAPAASVVPTSH